MTGDRLKLYFRGLIIASLIGVIIYSLVSDLEVVPDISQDTSPGLLDAVLIPIFIVLVIAHLCASVGMFFFRLWARQLFLVTTVIAVILSPFSGASVSGAWEGAIDYVLTLLEGGIIVAAYFSPVGKKFIAKPIKGVYLAYQHPALGYAVVKHGFSWPAFFFGWIWAFVKKLYSQAVIIMAGLLLLGLLDAAFTQMGLAVSSVIIGFYFIVFFLFVGFMGNQWLQELFLRRGYQFCGKYSGGSADAVLAEITNSTRNEGQKPMGQSMNNLPEVGNK